MKKINQDEVERWLYLRREMAVSDKVSQISGAKRQGRKEGLISIIQKKYRKGKPLEVIAEEAEEEVEAIRGIYEMICKNPEKSEEEIWELLRLERQ